MIIIESFKLVGPLLYVTMTDGILNLFDLLKVSISHDVEVTGEILHSTRLSRESSTLSKDNGHKGINPVFFCETCQRHTRPLLKDICPDHSTLQWVERDGMMFVYTPPKLTTTIPPYKQPSKPVSVKKLKKEVKIGLTRKFLPGSPYAKTMGLETEIPLDLTGTCTFCGDPLEEWSQTEGTGNTTFIKDYLPRPDPDRPGMTRIEEVFIPIPSKVIACVKCSLRVDKTKFRATFD